MERKISRISQAIARALSSKWAWRTVLGLLIIESVWFVLSAKYPMAFDENYHFGLIKLHAQQWLPFFTSQPPDSSAYGAIVRDPSYLYHWLMSFPYRIIALFTSNETIQIIVLRLLNVGLFVWGMILSRRLVRRLGASAALAHSLLAIFVLIPVVPFLAATINYDNLFFVTVALTFLWTLRLHDGFVRRTVDARWLLGLVALGLFSSLVKYPYLPIIVAAAVFILWRLWRTDLLSRQGLKSFKGSFRALPRWTAVTLIVACVVGASLFAERYVPNLVTYHNPVPGCSEVLTDEECMQYGPYNRDKILSEAKPDSFKPSHAWYTQQWLYGMWMRLFFAINHEYATAEPLPVISRMAIVVSVLLFLGIVVRWKQLFRRHPARQFVLGTIVLYVAILISQGWSAYVKTTQPVAINGRYLLPFIPLFFALGGIAWSQLLRKVPVLKSLSVSLILAVLVLQGGGTMTFIIRSGDDWMWDNARVQEVNRSVRSHAWPYILKY